MILVFSYVILPIWQPLSSLTSASNDNVSYQTAATHLLPGSHLKPSHYQKSLPTTIACILYNDQHLLLFFFSAWFQRYLSPAGNYVHGFSHFHCPLHISCFHFSPQTAKILCFVNNILSYRSFSTLSVDYERVGLVVLGRCLTSPFKKVIHHWGV